MRNLRKDLKDFPSYCKGIYKLSHHKYANFRRICAVYCRNKNEKRDIIYYSCNTPVFNSMNWIWEAISLAYMHTYIFLFKVEKNHNSSLTNKNCLKFLKKLLSYKVDISYIDDKSVTQVTRTIVTTWRYLCKIFKLLHFG